MPELPEVETIVSGLIPQVQGQVITAVTVLNDSSVEGSRLALEQYVAGRPVTRIHRRGKLLLMDLGEVGEVGKDVTPAAQGEGEGSFLSPTAGGPKPPQTPLSGDKRGARANALAPCEISGKGLGEESRDTAQPNEYADTSVATLPSSRQLQPETKGFAGDSQGELLQKRPLSGVRMGEQPIRGADPLAVGEERALRIWRAEMPLSSQAASYSAQLASRMKHADDYPTQLGIHLKMSGRLFVYDAGTPPEKHTRIIFDLSNGKRLFFDDMRKFGYCRPLSPADRDNWKFLKTLGPEPLEITQADFVALFAKRRTRIKAALLDQKVIAGIGNIYADESLFRAGIRPDAVSNTIPADKLKALHTHLQAVLLQSIKECGSSIKDYRDAHGDAGAFQNNFAVYGRSGCLCTACKAPLVTAKVAGRTTVFCEKCQS